MSNEWVSVVPSLVNIGFSIVVAWYLLAKGLPHIQDKFSEDLKDQRADLRRWIESDICKAEKLVEVIVSSFTGSLSSLAMQLHNHDEKVEKAIILINEINNRLMIQCGEKAAPVHHEEIQYRK